MYLDLYKNSEKKCYVIFGYNSLEKNLKNRMLNILNERYRTVTISLLNAGNIF